MDGARVRSLVNHLRGAVPVGAPVSVRFRTVANQQGGCSWSGRRYSINVSRNLDTQAALGCAVHEWAHAVAWGLDGDDPHGEMFREALRVVFGAYVDWLGGDGGVI